MSRLALVQSELKTNVDNLKDLEEILSLDPTLSDALAMKAEVLVRIEELEKELATLKPTNTATAEVISRSPLSPSPAAEKWSKDNHPAFRKNAAVTPAPIEEQKTFKVNDTVSAKYAGDKSFYPATIISITGSSAAPIYTVKFKGYDELETVRAHQIRPINAPAAASGQKRKADGSAVVSAPSTPVVATPSITHPGVISAAASIDTELANKIKQDANKVLDGPAAKKPKKKNPASKALDKSKANWQDFQKGKAAKFVQKESMFRTGEAPTARVGFTGSGRTMTKDQGRSRHTYQLDDER